MPDGWTDGWVHDRRGEKHVDRYVGTDILQHFVDPEPHPASCSAGDAVVSPWTGRRLLSPRCLRLCSP
eukprot:165802-Chlamydomonas_euryale.AAC.1